MRTFLIAVLTVTVALAGCSDSGDDEPTATSTPTQTTSTTATSTTATATSTTTGTTSPEPEENETTPNTPPSGSLTASFTSGEVPLEVAFDLDGSDADGDALTWTFDADEDGTFELEGSEDDLPAGLSFEFTTEGTYNATLTLDDGVNQTVEWVLIEVSEATPSGPKVQEFSASWVSDNLACLGGPLDPTGMGEGTTHVTMDVDAETWGQDFLAEMTGIDALWMDMKFFDASGSELAYYSTSDGGDFYTIDTADPIPDNAATAVFWTCLGIQPGVYYHTGDF